MKKKFKTLSIVMVMALVAANVTFVVCDNLNRSREIMLSEVEGLTYNPDWLTDLFSNKQGPRDYREQECEPIVFKSIKSDQENRGSNKANAGVNATWHSPYQVKVGGEAGYSGSFNWVQNTAIQLDEYKIPLVKHEYIVCLSDGSGSHCEAKDITKPCSVQAESILRRYNIIR